MTRPARMHGIMVGEKNFLLKSLRPLQRNTTARLTRAQSKCQSRWPDGGRSPNAREPCCLWIIGTVLQGVGRLHPRPHIQKCTESRLQGCRGAVLKGCKSDADACSTSGPCGNAAPAYSGERFGGSNESRLQLKRQGRQRRQRNKNWAFANPSVRELRYGRRRNFRRCCRHSASLHVVAGSLRAATSLVSLITASRRRRCLGRSRRRAGIDPRSKCQS